MQFDFLKRREFITFLGGTVAAWPLAAAAQQTDQMRRIGVLMVLGEGDPEARASVAALQQGLDSVGWVVGRNVRIEYRFATADIDQVRMFAKELVELRPDVIVTRSTPAVRAVMRETRMIPIVFTQVIEPDRQGIIETLSRPGGNATGFTPYEASIGTKWLELLKEIAPDVKKIAVIFNPAAAPWADFFLRSIDAAAPPFAINPIATRIHDPNEIERVVEDFALEPNGGLIVLPDAFATSHRGIIIAAAARHRVPAVYPFRACAVEGGLISFGPEAADAFRQAASYVDRILKGAKPADLPVQAPIKFPLVINLRTAKTLGLTVSLKLQAGADEVIE
jgi:putative ABC transport system substrate-binding protein